MKSKIIVGLLVLCLSTIIQGGEKGKSYLIIRFASETIAYEFDGPIKIKGKGVRKVLKKASKLTVKYLDEQGKPKTEVFLGKLPEIYAKTKPLYVQVADAKKVK